MIDFPSLADVFSLQLQWCSFKCYVSSSVLSVMSCFSSVFVKGCRANSHSWWQQTLKFSGFITEARLLSQIGSFLCYTERRSTRTEHYDFLKGRIYCRNVVLDCISWSKVYITNSQDCVHFNVFTITVDLPPLKRSSSYEVLPPYSESNWAV